MALLADSQVSESSGIVAGRRTPGVLWTHNDSGDRARLFATDTRGRALGTLSVDGARAVDWEDIAAGPGADGRPALYIGDIGDNARRRYDTVVYRVAEPAVRLDQTGQTWTTERAERFPFVYPDGHHDAETLMVHPVTAEVFVVSKKENGENGVYRFPMPLTPGAVATLERVGTVVFNNPLVIRRRAVGKLATGGDIAPDGRHFVVRSYTEAFEWEIKPGQTVAQALAGKRSSIDVPWLGQFESIGYSVDGRTLFTTSEGKPCPLWAIPLTRR